MFIFLTNILSNSFVFADMVDGDSFLKSIKGSDHDNIYSIAEFYDGYISGVADSTVNVNWCPPYDLKRSKLIKIITKYYKTNHRNSGEVSTTAKDLILRALIDSYPCKK